MQGCHAYPSAGMFTETTTVGGVEPSQFATSQVTVSAPPAPTVSSSDPDALGQRATAMSITGSLKAGSTKTVTVLGKRFQSGLTVTTNIFGATVGSPTNLSPTSFRVSATVPNATGPGNYQLTVTYPDMGTFTYSGLKVH